MIENVARYEAAIRANIKANRRVGNERRWIAETGEAQVKRITDFLNCVGEFALIPVHHPDGSASSRLHPMVAASQGEFYSAMSAALNEWGRLTPAQERGVLGLLERATKRIAERAEAQANRVATSKHVGTIGQRATLDLVVKMKKSFDGMYGVSYIFVCETPEQAVVVYKGSSDIAAPGETIKMVATITEHGSRDGVAQTIVKRPKVLAVA